MQAEHLEVLLEPLGKHVRSYYGNQGGGTLPKDTSVAVCTIEKANSLLNRLLEDGRLSEVGIIVIDELHMVLYSLMIFAIHKSATKDTFAFQIFICFFRSCFLGFNSFRWFACLWLLNRLAIEVGVIFWN